MDAPDDPERWEPPSMRGRSGGTESYPQDYRLGTHAAHGLYEWAQEQVDRDVARYQRALAREGDAAQPPLTLIAIPLASLEHLERWLDDHGVQRAPRRDVDVLLRQQLDDARVQRLAATASAALVQWAGRECDAYAQRHPNEPRPKVENVVGRAYTYIAGRLPS